MLTLITGRAGTGKTAFVLNDIRQKMSAGESGLLLIVPEQYSHDAERQLVSVCGDRLSLHGEVLSFSRLCTRVFTETGGAALREIDGGGLILIMHRALEEVAPSLLTFGTKGKRTELLEKLIAASKEFKSLSISPDDLAQLSERTDGTLSDKLQDLALILGAYDSLLLSRGMDPSDRLSRLADQIGDSTVGDMGHIYFDGFNDFTAQETRVIEELLCKNADITVCLTCDDPHCDDEVFALPRKTIATLRRIAEDYGVPVQTLTMDTPPAARPAELVFLEEHLFGHDTEQFFGDCKAIQVYSAPTQYVECEYAACKVLELVRGGMRWRDIGVMARDWEEYGPICENIFSKYGVQFFSSGRVDILNKPPIALIDAALEIITSGWEYRAVFRYLKTGLLGINPDSCAELENYVLKWNVRGGMWNRDWTLPPSGADTEDTLARLNSLRRYITEPLLRLRDGMKGNADEKLRALYGFFEDIELPERLEEKARDLHKRGEMRLADEYEQLWAIIKNALEQMFAILGDSAPNPTEFRKLLTLTLTQYDVGVIPVSLDRTVLGGMAMSRRRDLKCLIILGATGDNMPKLVSPGGALSDSEREELSKLGADMPAGLSERLSRELNMIYSTLTLPSQELILTYPGGGGRGRPSFIVQRIRLMFGINAQTLRKEEYMSAAELPCFELASLSGDLGPMAAAAHEYFAPNMPYLHTAREPLGADAAARLYGCDLTLSPSRVDRYYACPFEHFLQSGLKLAPRVPEKFDAPEAGVFLHYLLEGVSREIKAAHGFKNADESLSRAISARLVERYVQDVLLGFEDRTERFIYLFRRLEQDSLRIVQDMVDELKYSDFEPLDFELRFDTSPIKGIADRIDGWIGDGGKLYLRVVDYKTGKKSFDLSDVLYGRDMQMLLYLSALQKFGEERYGKEVAPAGVLYVPARDVILKAQRNSTPEELQKQRERELKRGGLVLDNPDVINAMENGYKRYLPVKSTKDGIKGDALISAEQFEQISGHVENMLCRARERILSGSIERSPYYKNVGDNVCMYCQYHAVCGFDEDMGDKRRYVRKVKPAEVWDMLEGGSYEQT